MKFLKKIFTTLVLKYEWGINEKANEKIVLKYIESLNWSFTVVIISIFFLAFWLILLFLFHLKQIEMFLDYLYFENIMNFLYSNLKAVITSFIAYLIFLAFIIRKKGLIFSLESNTVDANYWWLFILLYNSLSFFYLFYILYLVEKNWFDYLVVTQQIFFIILFVLTHFLLIPSFFEEKRSTIKKIMIGINWLSIIVILTLPYFKIWYFEIAIVLIISSILTPSVFLLRKKYMCGYKNIAFLRYINQHWRKTPTINLFSFNKKLDYEFRWERNNALQEIESMFVWFDYLVYLILLIFVLAFSLPIIWIYYNFNLLSIIYIHFELILIFLTLNLISNRYSEYVSIKFDNNIHQWYLLENSKEKVIISSEEHTYIIKPEKVEYIKVLKR